MKRNLNISFSFAFVIIAVFQTVPAFANVPAVTGVTAWTRQSDNRTILNITVTHGAYFSGHYVNRIQVNISGPIQTINMTESSPADQAASSIFVIPYDMGVVLDTPTVSARYTRDIATEVPVQSLCTRRKDLQSSLESVCERTRARVALLQC